MSSNNTPPSSSSNPTPTKLESIRRVPFQTIEEAHRSVLEKKSVVTPAEKSVLETKAEFARLDGECKDLEGRIQDKEQELDNLLKDLGLRRSTHYSGRCCLVKSERELESALDHVPFDIPIVIAQEMSRSVAYVLIERARVKFPGRLIIYQKDI